MAGKNVDQMTETTLDVTAVIEKTKSDPRFIRGLALLKEKRYEEAVAVYEDMLRTMVEVEMESESLSIAPVYYEYGHALCSLAESNSSVFGGGGGDGDQEEEGNEAANTTDDFQVAWEMLEIARVIYSRFPNELAIEKELARVYMRLGDLGMESDVFTQAKSDYETSLMLRKKILTETNDPDTTLLADLYCCLAISCIYHDTNDNMNDYQEEGMKYYILAGQVMAENIYRVINNCPKQVIEFVTQRIPKPETSSPMKGKGKQKESVKTLAYLMENMMTLKEDFLTCTKVYKSLSDEKNELTEEEAQVLEYMEIYVELKEKVDGLKETMQAQDKVKPTSTESSVPVTTIGFGTTSTTPVVSDTTSSVNVLPVAKKRKITPTLEQK